MARLWISRRRVAGELFSDQPCRAAHIARPVIEFRDVNKWFGPLHVLKDINLKIGAGEVVVVCGPSGSGKSTLIRCINCLEPIQRGDILVEGESITGRSVNLARLRAEV